MVRTTDVDLGLIFVELHGARVGLAVALPGSAEHCETGCPQNAGWSESCVQ